MIVNDVKWVFFDLDGTLVDSINIMYDVYMNFLKFFQKIGTREEFEKLNGPSLNEIVYYLKTEYELNWNVSDLSKKYQTMIHESYVVVKPFKNSTIVLENLYEKQYKLALVSSTGRQIVQKILNDFNWSKYFSIIITGDDIKISKPSPEIYHLCISKSKTNKKNILAIEDSKNGYDSATKAGLKCIKLDKDNNLRSIMTMLT
jgi:HAD superfamily hydrolase (TIGR01509 family)